jgi:hypothetical protein
MWYELWGVESGNLIDDFGTEAEALAAARAYLMPDDTGAIMDVALVVYDDDGRPVRSARGPELAALAQATGAEPRPRLVG